MNSRAALIEAARGSRPLSLAILNVNLVNVFTCEVYPADVGVFGERIAVIGPPGEYDLEAERTIDGQGLWITPGFVDTHLHIESTMVTPPAYAAGVLPRGTTSSVIDPHEIGNVLGMEGVRYMVESSKDIPLHVSVCVPSCVPAVVGGETAGAHFGPEEVTEMLTWPGVIGVAEVMDYMGVVQGDPRMLGIVQAGLDAASSIQGHSPLLRGRDCSAYLAAGIQDDHELRDGAEGLEKLRLGMLPLLKVSSHGNHVPNILPALIRAPHLDIALCTDDVEPSDLLENGHMDRVVNEMMRHGVEPARAVRWATLNGARHYQMRDRGGLAPGFFADLLLLDSLEPVRVRDVFVGGKQVVEDGQLTVSIPLDGVPAPARDTMLLQHQSAEDLIPSCPVRDGMVPVNTMHLLPSRLTKLRRLDAQVREGRLSLNSLSDDACHVAVVPRHGQSHGPGLSLLTGLGMKQGAIASTVAHDSHNLLIVGRDAHDMAAAAEHLRETRGGICIVVDGQVTASVPLPIAGLMSDLTVPEVAAQMDNLHAQAAACGIRHTARGLSTTGLALTVIPDISASDIGGLFDVHTQEAIHMFP